MAKKLEPIAIIEVKIAGFLMTFVTNSKQNRQKKKKKKCVIESLSPWWNYNKSQTNAW